MRIILTEGNGLTIPALTTVLTCGKDSAYQPFANTVGYDYYVYQIYNTGNCKIKIDVQELTPAGMVVGGNLNSNEVAPNTQLTLAFDAPAVGNKTRFIFHCLEGVPPNGCSFNFKFNGGKKINDKEWQKSKEYSKGNSRDNTIRPIDPGNCKTDSATLWVVKNLTKDAEMEVEAYFKNNGTCPATCCILSEDKKINGSKLEMESSGKTATFTSVALKHRTTITFKGFCKEYAMTPKCTIGIDSLRFR